MAETIKAGSILIEGRALLPESLLFESEPCSNGWRLVNRFDRFKLDQRVRQAGWNCFSVGGEVQAGAFGLDVERTTQRAFLQVLSALKSTEFNCLEITQVALNRFLGVHHMSVSARPRYIQEGSVCSQSEVATI
jgi:hypothetical protein